MPLLSNNQQSKFTMYHSNDSILQDNDNKVIYAIHPKFTNLAGLAHTNLGKIDLALQKYQTSKHGDVVVKVENKKAMSKAAKKICRPIVAFCKDENHLELLSIFDFSMTDIFRMRDLASLEQSLTIITETNKLLTKYPVLTTDYLIDAALVQKLVDACNDFETSLDIVTTDKGEKLSIYDHINKLFAEQDRIIDIMVDLSVYFEDYNHGFSEHYNNSLRIIDTAHGHINIKGHITDKDNDASVYQAVGKLFYGEEILETHSSEKGNIQYKNLESGLYRLDIEHFAYVTHSEEVEVYDDKTTNLAIKLTKKGS